MFTDSFCSGLLAMKSIITSCSCLSLIVKSSSHYMLRLIVCIPISQVTDCEKLPPGHPHTLQLSITVPQSHFGVTFSATLVVYLLSGPTVPFTSNSNLRPFRFRSSDTNVIWLEHVSKIKMKTMQMYIDIHIDIPSIKTGKIKI